MPDDQRAVAAVEDLLEHDDLAGALEAARGDDVHRLVEHDLLAVLELVAVDLGRDGDAQLAAGGEDVDGAVLEGLEEHAVAARRLGEAVDLLLELHHLVAGLAQRVGEPLVAVAERGQPGLGLGQPVLEQAHVARRLGDLRPQQLEFLLEERGAAAQVRIVAGRVRSCPLRGSLRHGGHLPGPRGVFAKSHPTHEKSSRSGSTLDVWQTSEQPDSPAITSGFARHERAATGVDRSGAVHRRRAVRAVRARGLRVRRRRARLRQGRRRRPARHAGRPRRRARRAAPGRHLLGEGCPGDCIHVVREGDGVEVAGPDAS